VDASQRLLEEYRRRFPAAMTEHAAVQESEFFAQKFDGIVAWGLLFLLAAEAQPVVLRKMAKALQPRGRLLFTAPREAVRWKDAMTRSESVSLGREAYRRILQTEGLLLQQETRDQGRNHYYFASKA
jgi:chemotaxis methyl-accepting protein methylase